MAETSRVLMLRRRAGLAVSAVVLVGTVASCTSNSGVGTASGAGSASDTTTPRTSSDVTEPSETAPSDTTAPDASTTVEGELVATTLEATTTTVAPTTTVPPSTLPLPKGPFNRVAIAKTAAPLAAVGSSGGAETARIQQRLLDLGFWLNTTSGSFELTTTQAVMAFQKYIGLPATGSVDTETAAFLTNMELRPFGAADSGTMIEVDKTRQLIFFLIDGTTKWVFNTSTGNDLPYREEDQNSPGEIVEDVALTPEGFHRVNRERPEGWWEGDLGKIYRPKYFVGGVAIHGSNSVPNYPASHGCVRVTLQAMDFIWDQGLMPIGLPVWVHGNPPARA